MAISDIPAAPEVVARPGRCWSAVAHLTDEAISTTILDPSDQVRTMP